MHRYRLSGLLLGALLLAGCGDKATLPVEATIGPKPQLTEPRKELIPNVQIASATGWSQGAGPVAGEGLQAALFADGLAHPRNVMLLPNGDVLVAETDAPPKPDDKKGIRGWIMGMMMKKAGSGTPSANRITLLRAGADGIARERFVFLENLNSPFGMVLVGDQLYVANTDSVMRFPYRDGDTQITAPGTKLVDLPGGTINHHWTKNLAASADGTKLYATIGSNSNAAENGIDKEEGRAAIWEIDIATGAHRSYASGLRNPNGIAIEPSTGTVWTSVNERDEIGSDLVPDYMTSVKPGGFYGWPYSWYGNHVDARVTPQRPDLVAQAIVPDYALGAHTASLGLTFSHPGALPPQFHNGAFVGQHGSWNRDPPSGYKVIFVPFDNGKPSGMPIDVLTGFLDKDGNAQGRPVGVTLDRQGALLVADDVGGRIWRVTAATPGRPAVAAVP